MIASNITDTIDPQRWYRPREIVAMHILTQLFSITEEYSYHLLLRLIEKGDIKAQDVSREGSKIHRFRVIGTDLITYLQS